MNRELDKLTDMVILRLKKYGLKGRTITLKIKYSDFRIITRRLTFDKPVDDNETIASAAKKLLESSGLLGKKIRLLGITLSNFGEISAKPKREGGEEQLQLF
jgi:DNA polymerase-4